MRELAFIPGKKLKLHSVLGNYTTSNGETRYFSHYPIFSYNAHQPNNNKHRIVLILSRTRLLPWQFFKELPNSLQWGRLADRPGRVIYKIMPFAKSLHSGQECSILPLWITWFRNQGQVGTRQNFP